MAVTVTLNPASNATAGQVVTATIVRDIAPSTVSLTVTEANGESGSASVKVEEPVTWADASSTPHVWTQVSDDGTTLVLHTTA